MGETRQIRFAGAVVLCAVLLCAQSAQGVAPRQSTPLRGNGSDNKVQESHQEPDSKGLITLDETSAHECHKDEDCNEGKCDSGKCDCHIFYGGDNCSLHCNLHCSQHGSCRVHKTDRKMFMLCECEHGWGGADCAKPTCPNDCSDHGTCNKDHTCACKKGWAGLDCSIECDGGVDTPCSNQGTCHHMTGVCICERGFIGRDCKHSCPGGTTNTCSNHGHCVTGGICICHKDWEGDNCEKSRLQLGKAGDACLKNAECETGLCVDNICTSKKAGFSCAVDSDCFSGSCDQTFGKCTEVNNSVSEKYAVMNFSNTNTDVDVAIGFLGMIGQGCTTSQWCRTENCVAHTCEAPGEALPLSPNGVECMNGQENATYKCLMNVELAIGLAVRPIIVAPNLIANGAHCNNSLDCASEFCFKSKCAVQIFGWDDPGLHKLGEACDSNSICMTQNCREGICLATGEMGPKQGNGQVCTSSSVCATGRCAQEVVGEGETVMSCKPLMSHGGQTCEKIDECYSNECLDGKCTESPLDNVDPGTPCSSSKDCGRGLCVAGACSAPVPLTKPVGSNIPDVAVSAREVHSRISHGESNTTVSASKTAGKFSNSATAVKFSGNSDNTTAAGPFSTATAPISTRSGTNSTESSSPSSSSKKETGYTRHTVFQIIGFAFLGTLLLGLLMFITTRIFMRR